MADRRGARKAGRSGFPGQPFIVLADGGDGSLERFLAKLFGAMGDAAVEQLARIGHVGAFLGTLAQAQLEIVQGEVGHGKSPGLP